MYSANGVQHIAAGTTPLALMLFIVGIFCFCALMRKEVRVNESQVAQVAPLWRRYIALLIDWWFCIFTFATLSATVPLILEARRTGTFLWSFDREYWVYSDWAGETLFFFAIAGIAAYFVLPLANRRQTLGCWVLRIATVNLDGSVVRVPLRIAFQRAYSELSELFSPFSLLRILTGKAPQEGTKHDRYGGFMVVRY
ncbi:MAG TPA: RDD family protein [Candidatus Acidoferrum sp.]|nr:RDD family protein [Candidatus Acidoferrum sp.]